ncbi:MAG: TrkA family potassium uptake protein [Campylobacterales bacterium]|nr:TrkA family potassium uptake protein [Campylobacterales bacterium]
MQNKIVIFSLSTIGLQIARVLQQKNYKIVVVEDNEDKIEKAKSMGFSVYHSNLMDDEDIIKLGIKEDSTIKAFFCVSDDKNTNLFITLSVRNLNKAIKIISVSFTKEDNKTMILAGANKIINPYEIGALRIFRLLHKPLILDVLDNILFSESDIVVSEITIQKGTNLDGVYLNDLGILNKSEIIILGIQDKELSSKFIFSSSGINHKIDAGDTLVLLGKSHDLHTFKKNLIHLI